MTVTDAPWASPISAAMRLELLRVSTPVLSALGNDETDAASRSSNVELTPYLLGENCRWLWRFRSEQTAQKPADAAWITRIVLDVDTNVAVGLAGFHGAPDENGMVEIGYQIDPIYRRRGYARSALEILLRTANNDAQVHVVRATISPDNIPSLALIDQYGFREVGEQWDEEDGLEIIFEK